MTRRRWVALAATAALGAAAGCAPGGSETQVIEGRLRTGRDEAPGTGTGPRPATPASMPSAGATPIDYSVPAYPLVIPTPLPSDLKVANVASIAGQPALALTTAGDPQGVWRNGPALARPRAGLALGVVDGVLIAAEGDHRPSYELTNGAAWIVRSHHDARDPVLADGEVHHGRRRMAAAVGPDALWLAGGDHGIVEGDGKVGLGEVVAYRPGTGAKLEKALRVVPVAGAAALVVDQTLVVAGGTTDDRSARAEVARVPLAGGAAGAGKPMPKAVADAAAVALGGTLWLLGGAEIGAGGARTAVDAVQGYDPAADAWKAAGAGGGPPKLPAALHGAAAAVLGEEVWLVGGAGPGRAVKAETWRWKPGDPAWRPGPRLAQARALLGLAAFDGELWAVGGMGADGRPLATVEVVRP